MHPIIKVRGLSKRYRVGQQQRYGSLRESLASKFSLPRLLSARNPKGGTDAQLHIWALHDVSFDVAPGEILGLIGANGAGKSTALKILSRVTRPTAGRVELYGRVRSLLEVGTGFHPELTGRENVFLNGAILGMRRSEIARKFDDIVAFAEVEKFIDTPVKHYSSGMYVRLAFAVAAYLEPDILLVDEVLAVGDNRFWQKSTDKMRELNAQGMTIVLVTHNMWLMQTVCTRGVLLKHGRVALEGEPRLVIDVYRRATDSLGEQPTAVRHRIKEAAVTCIDLVPLGEWTSEHQATPGSGIRLGFAVFMPVNMCVKFFIRVASLDGFTFFTVYSEPMGVPASCPMTCEATIPRLMLNGGDYVVWVGACSDREQEDVIVQARLPLVVRQSIPPRHESGVFWNSAEWKISRSTLHPQVSDDPDAEHTNNSR
jgi:ABC-type polysaccharide/polyol phosphate transport system ATPase subunit